jgi:hypothetical protein
MPTKVLRTNAASCLVFGGVFVAMPGLVAGFLGTPPVWLVAALGAGLIVNGAHLLWAARRGPGRPELLYFALGDGAWVAGTVLLVATGTWITTPAGVIAALTVAAVVGVFGVLQWKRAAHAGAGTRSQKSRSA